MSKIITREFYDLCHVCGGEYVGIEGMVFDSMPAHYPVKCKACGTESRSNLRTECEEMGWPPPDAVLQYCFRARIDFGDEETARKVFSRFHRTPEGIKRRSYLEPVRWSACCHLFWARALKIIPGTNVVELLISGDAPETRRLKAHYAGGLMIYACRTYRVESVVE